MRPSRTCRFTKKHPALHPLSIFAFLALLLGVSACSSNPVDPLDAQDPPEAQKAVRPTHAPHKNFPVEEVTYLMWSEKGVRAEVAVSMWIPDDGGFVKERITLSDQPVQRTFYIHPDEHRDVDFALYNLTKRTIVRASILVDGNVVASGEAMGPVPLLSLDTRSMPPCHIGMAPCAMP